MNELETIEKYYAFIKELNFLQGHELMEDLWMEVRKRSEEDSLVYRGLINAATTFVLHQKGRASFTKTWATYLKYCENYHFKDLEKEMVFQEIKTFLEKEREDLEAITNKLMG